MILGATETAYTHGMRHIVMNVCLENPRASEKELHELAAKALLDHPAVIEEVVIYAAVNLTNNYRRVFEPSPSNLAVSRAAQTRVDEIKLKAREQMQLLGMICPNGKPLVQCTYGECSQFGGWYTRLAKGKDPAQQVQETEAELRKLQTWIED